MKSQLMYVELKTGYNNDGPAWIGEAFFSKTGKSVYFNGLSFSKGNRNGGNYYDMISGEYYWISGIKKEELTGIGLGMEKLKLIRMRFPNI